MTRSGHRAGARSLLVLALISSLPAPSLADSYEIGIENFLYRSTATLLNRDNAFGLAPTENLLRLVGTGRWSFGKFSAKASAFAERQSGKADDTRLTVRQAFLEYRPDPGFLLRVGKQKTAWGSGFVWNPTARLEPPKSPANPGTEQPGIDAVRMDVSPADWASLTLVAGRARASLTDLPGSLGRDVDSNWTAALRARLLAGSTDIALTYAAGTDRPGLLGLDLGETWGPVALHAEAALYRGSELDPLRARDRFFRIATGALWSPGDSSFAVEYFFNGEGMNGSEFAGYTARLDRNFTLARDPRAAPLVRSAALAQFTADAALPFSPNLGLRRHYGSLSFTRRGIADDLSLNLRAVRGLSDRGLIVTPGLAYAPTPHLQMSLDLVLLFGPAAAEYKLAPIRRAVQARLKYLF